MTETQKPVPAAAPPPKAATPPPAAGAVAKSSPQAMQKVVDLPIFSEIATQVQQFVEAGVINLPSDYSAGNALKAAELVLKDMKDADGVPTLSRVTPYSVGNALLKMVTLGLSIHKGQGSFIKYGDRIVWQTDYAGNITLAKRYGNLKETAGNVIYEDDKFEFEIDSETGRKKLVKHVTDWKKWDPNKIIGAYAVVTLNDGAKDLEIMTMDQITRAWMQGAAKGDSPAHKNFKDQMCLKTVKGRAVKLLIRTSNDAPVLAQEDDENESDNKPTFQEIKQAVKTISIAAEELSEVPEAQEVHDTPVPVDNTVSVSQPEKQPEAAATPPPAAAPPKREF